MSQSFEQETKRPTDDAELERLEKELLAKRDARELEACSLMETILSLFPLRCSEPIKGVSPIPPPMPGCPVGATGASDVRRRVAQVPVDSGLSSRIVREHEAAHLNLTTGQPKGMADQAAEDGIIETFRCHYPITARWVVAAGIQDVRNGTRYLLHPEKYAVPPQLVEMTRHVSLVQVFRGVCRILAHRNEAQGNRALRRAASIPAAVWPILYSAQRLIERVKYRPLTARQRVNLRKKVARTLAPLFASSPPPPPPPRPPISRGWEKPVVTVDLTRDGTAQTVLTETYENRRNGIRLRPSALVHAALSPTTAKPFVRVNKEPGVSVLIDASGSMSLTSDDVREIIKAYPASTIAYYVAGGRVGYMVLCARDGKVTRKEYLPYVGELSGNEIDYTALLWLLKQDAPRYFITDGGFCGGLAASARRLFDRAIQEKKIIWVDRTQVNEAVKHITKEVRP